MTASKYTTDPELAAYYEKVIIQWRARGDSWERIDRILYAWSAEDAPDAAIAPPRDAADDDDNPAYCAACQGTGIGAADGPCYECNGYGLEGGPWRSGRYGYADDDDAERVA